MKKKTIIFLAILCLAIFYKWNGTSGHKNIDSPLKTVTEYKRSEQLKKKDPTIPKAPDIKTAPSKVSNTESTPPFDINETKSTIPSKEMKTPEVQDHIVHFEAKIGDSGYIELAPSCKDCKPPAYMTLGNSMSGVRVKGPRPNSKNIKELKKGTESTFGFLGTCGFQYHVVLVFSYSPDASGKAMFRKIKYRFHTGGIQEEALDLSSKEFLMELENANSLTDCEMIRTPA